MSTSPKWNLGPYEITREIGRGHFGAVHEATDTSSGRCLALKLVPLNGNHSESQEMVEAERRGAELQQRFSRAHPQFVPEVFEHKEIESYYVIAMELVLGEPLTSAIARGPFEVRRAVDIAISVCEFLARAHTFKPELEGSSETQIVHGDLKPAHILLRDGDGTVCILDFGIAKALTAGRAATTNKWCSIDYASPERLESGDVNPHVDLWALGIMLFEMVAGFHPYKAFQDNPSRLETAIRRQELRAPVPAGTDPVLTAIVDKLLKPQIERRYASAGAIRRDLEAFCDREPTVAAMEIDTPVTERLFPSGARAPVTPPSAQVRVTPVVPTPASAPPAVAAAMVAVPFAVWWRRAAVMTPGFAATAVALSVGRPLDTWGLGSLPSALFGLLLGMAVLKTWGRRLALAAASVALYNVVAAVYGLLLYVSFPPVLKTLAGFPLSGALGAIAVAQCLKILRSSSKVAVGGVLSIRPSTALAAVAAAGFIGGLAFHFDPLLGQLESSWRAHVGFVTWQVLVGCALAADVGTRYVKGQVSQLIPWQPRLTWAVTVLSLFVAAGIWGGRQWRGRHALPPTAGQRERNPKDGLTYLWIPPGEFLMGCSQSPCHADDQPPHKVSISEGFWIGQTEVPSGRYKAVMSTMPAEPAFAGRSFNPAWYDGNQPVVNVTWHNAQNYCRRIGGRLPTEAQWEYAARARSTGKTYGRLPPGEIAWYLPNSGNSHDYQRENRGDDALKYAVANNENRLHKTGAGKWPNDWGLSDMLGNAWEWVLDDYWVKTYDEDHGKGLVHDPQKGPDQPLGRLRVIRGESFLTDELGVSDRGAAPPEYSGFDLGFRCVWNKELAARRAGR